MNEPAFPNEGFNGWGEPFKGMTLRDYFAAQAIPIAFQMLNKEFNLLEEGAWTWHEQDFRTLSERAYRMADAMMDTRSK
jgi:hypothetical protein